LRLPKRWPRSTAPKACRDDRWRDRGLDVGRALGDVVDEAASRGHAAFDAGDAFEEFDALLVFERHILLAGDGHAVDFEPGGEIDGKAANLVVAVVAHGNVVVVRPKRRS
jgi:hypothetical protein